MTTRILLALAAATTLTAATVSFADPDPKTPPTSPAKAPTKIKAPAPAEKEDGIAVGAVAPDWELKDRDGKTVKLSDLKGKVVLMDFWATWCGPCKAAMPGVQKLHDQFKDKNVVILGMNSWERDDTKPGKDGKKLSAAEKAAAYMDSKNYTYGLILKADDVAKTYGVNGIPTFYVIGTDGKVLMHAVGSGPENEEKLHKTIEKAVADMDKAKETKPATPATEPAKKTG